MHACLPLIVVLEARVLASQWRPWFESVCIRLTGSPQTLFITRLASLVVSVIVAVRQVGHTGTVHFKFYTVW